MNVFYLVGAMLFLIVPSYAYFVYVVAIKRIGQVLSGLFVAVVARMPRFMPERATTRMRIVPIKSVEHF
jgi:hypothetical protein